MDRRRPVTSWDLSFGSLDTNKNGVLDHNDTYVDIKSVTDGIAKASTVIYTSAVVHAHSTGDPWAWEASKVTLYGATGSTTNDL